MEAFRKPVYLDYHATTPVDPVVLESMLPFFTEHFGNPSSRSHPYGWKASEAVEIARRHVADMLRVNSEEIFFTSGATEALNMAIKGIAESNLLSGRHIITIATEHPAVLDPLKWLSKKGYEITVLPVNATGHIDLDQLADSLRNDTIMVTAMLANNETGVIHDVAAISEICADYHAVLICDGTQAPAKLQIDAGYLKVDVMTLSAHKLYGPKGVGAIYFSKAKKLKPTPLLHGGGHEQGYRSGTLNVPGIVGFGKAAELAEPSLKPGQLRDDFEKRILSSLEGVVVNGDTLFRLPSVSNLKVAFVDSQAVMTKLRNKISISSGSACSSANPSPSHVLLAMGLTPEEAKGSFRISFGKPTTRQEMEFAADVLIEAINDYRAESPIWQMYKKGIDLRGAQA